MEHHPSHLSEAPIDRRRALLSQVAALRDPQERLQWLVERARQRSSLPAEARTDACRVHGCMARLWWVAELRDGRWHLAADSDAVTLKAIVGLIAECYDDETSAGIVADPPDFLEGLGLLRQLAENRRATVLRVVHVMVEAARNEMSVASP